MNVPSNGTSERASAPTRRVWLLAAILVGLAVSALLMWAGPGQALATDFPDDPNTPVEYDGGLLPGVTVAGVIGWDIDGSPSVDGYDWYCFNAVAGQKIDLDALRITGDVLLNLNVWEGQVNSGDPRSALGSFLAGTSNSTDPDVSLNFTPASSGPVTVAVSTWLLQDEGLYSLTMNGGEGANCAGISKAPRLSNLWLCNTGAVTCENKASGVEGVNIDVNLSSDISTLDPKCVGFPNFSDPAICDSQEIGSFEFEVRFDAKYVTVDVSPGSIWGCIGENSAGAAGCRELNVECFTATGEGFIQFACVTKGKPANGARGPGTLAVVHVRPTADVYKLLIPNQENGIVTQLINQDCQLSDLQGHPIETDLCENAAITIRYLEGDVHADCVIDVLDQQQVAFRWGAQLGNLLYSPLYDLEPSFPKADGDIDAKDLQFVYGRHVEPTSTCKNPHPAQDPVDPQVKVDPPIIVE